MPGIAAPLLLAWCCSPFYPGPAWGGPPRARPRAPPVPTASSTLRGRWAVHVITITFSSTTTCAARAEVAKTSNCWLDGVSRCWELGGGGRSVSEMSRTLPMGSTTPPRPPPGRARVHLLVVPFVLSTTCPRASILLCRTAATANILARLAASGSTLKTTRANVDNARRILQLLGAPTRTAERSSGGVPTTSPSGHHPPRSERTG